MELLSRLCPVCHSNSYVEVFSQKFDNLIVFDRADEVYLQKIVICNDCGLIYNNPSPSYDALDKYYTSWSNYENPQNEGKETPEMDKKWSRTYDFVKKSFPENFKGKALEVGSATAFGLTFFKDNGWEVLGMDPSEKAVNLGKELYDIEIINGLFDVELLKGKKFDLVLFSHVLEHIIEPGDIVKALIPFMEPNGLIFIEVPNMLRPEVPMGYFTFEHLNYFSPNALINLMGMNGYELERMELFGGSMEILPFFPVISALYKVRTEGTSYQIINDYNETNAAVKKYVEMTTEVGDKINAKINGVLSKYEPQRIGLWGAGVHTSQLLSLTKLSEVQIGFVFDNDPKKHGHMLCNVAITGLNVDDIKDKVDCIIISSRAAENEIYQQIKFLEDFGIEIVKIYN